MKLQQLRYVWEIAQNDLNVSATAQSLYTSQPGISKQIRLLEDELGVEVFSRSGKHLTRVTPVGEQILEKAGEILRKVESIKQVAQEFSDNCKGSLSIATTHAQARYALPSIISKFITKFPDVSLKMHQGSPKQAAQMVTDGSVDFAIATEAMELFNNLIMMPCYKWSHCILVPKGHPLAHISTLSLQDIASYPLITYLSNFTGQSGLNEVFMNEGLSPRIVFTATDADIIKTYVRLKFGVGIVAKMAYDEELDSDLVALNVNHLFKPNITKIGFLKGSFLRGFMYEFVEDFAKHLTKDVIQEAISCHTKTELEELFSNMQLPSR